MGVAAALVHHGLHQQDEEEAGADEDLGGGVVVAVHEGVVVAGGHSEVGGTRDSRSGPQDVDDQLNLIVFRFQPGNMSLTCDSLFLQLLLIPWQSSI